MIDFPISIVFPVAVMPLIIWHFIPWVWFALWRHR